MTCLALETRSHAVEAGKWADIRAAVFWGFILLVIVSPAVLSAWILLQA